MSHVPVVTYSARDGDTVAATMTVHFAIRVIGVDTPEKANDQQSAAAEVVTAAVQRWISTHKLLFEPAIFQHDRYGGRIDAEVYGLTETGKLEKLSEYLLSNHLAHAYDGKAQRPPWFAEELKRIERWKG